LASGMEEGARETIERFAELVEAPKESGARPKKEQARGRAQKNGLVITRIFDAPPERVWKALTDPREMKQWWGPKGFTAPFISVDLRVGGVFRYCMRSPEGKDYWGTGVYGEIVPGERIVDTDSVVDEMGNVVQETYSGIGGSVPPAR